MPHTFLKPQPALWSNFLTFSLRLRLQGKKIGACGLLCWIGNSLDNCQLLYELGRQLWMALMPWGMDSSSWKSGCLLVKVRQMSAAAARMLKNLWFSSLIWSFWLIYFVFNILPLWPHGIVSGWEWIPSFLKNSKLVFLKATTGEMCSSLEHIIEIIIILW